MLDNIIQHFFTLFPRGKIYISCSSISISTILTYPHFPESNQIFVGYIQEIMRGLFRYDKHYLTDNEKELFALMKGYNGTLEITSFGINRMFCPFVPAFNGDYTLAMCHFIRQTS